MRIYSGAKQHDLACPKCKQHRLLIRDKIVRFRNECGVQLSPQEMEDLVRKGNTGLIRGMKSKKGKMFDAYIVMKGNGTTQIEFANTKRKG